MAFNLYFAGSQCKEADELMVKLNCNRLFSQENDRKNISNWQGYKHSRRTQYKGNIFIDLTLCLLMLIALENKKIYIKLVCPIC